MNNLAIRKLIELPLPHIRAALEPFGVTTTEAQAEDVRRYVMTLILWNQKINLTSVTGPIEIIERHFGESMFAAAAVPIERGRLADVGSGAGFPGLALKIVRAELDTVLIEPNARKAAFLAEVKRELGLGGVEIERRRYEELHVLTPAPDFVAARALGNYHELLSWSHRNLCPGGLVMLWLGAKDADEIVRAKNWRWRDAVPIPKSRRRVLLIGKRPKE